MARFVAALHEKDTRAFLKLFPRAGTWCYLGTITEPPQRSTHTYNELKRALSTETGLYRSLFGSARGDAFRDYVTRTQGRAWVRIDGQRFGPPGMADLHPYVFVRWRREAGEWVVDAIAEPSG
jgi:hypothetical protein